MGNEKCNTLSFFCRKNIYIPILQNLSFYNPALAYFPKHFPFSPFTVDPKCTKVRRHHHHQYAITIERLYFMSNKSPPNYYTTTLLRPTFQTAAAGFLFGHRSLKTLNVKCRIKSPDYEL